MIHLESVVKDYGGPLGRLAGRRVRALNGVSLDVAPGGALGVIGLNGAGKSTLLRVLLGYVHPTSGSAEIVGMPPRRYVETHGIGYVPEQAAIPPGWTVAGALRAYAMLANIGGDWPTRVEAAMRRLGIESLRDRRVGALSKGNRQRLAIAQMLLGDRKLLVLDEPTDGLDPVWIAELVDVVSEWRAADPARVVVFASHNLPVVERMVERVVVLHAGEVRERLDVGPDAPGHGTLEERFLALVAAWGDAA